MIDALATFLAGTVAGILLWELMNRRTVLRIIEHANRAIELAAQAMSSDDPDDDDPEREYLPEEEQAQIVAFSRRAS